MTLKDKRQNEQKGWLEAFNDLADEGDDSSLLEFGNEFDEEDWNDSIYQDRPSLIPKKTKRLSSN